MQAPASKLAVTRTSVGSKPQIAKTDEASWIGPGNIATFVRCLRLLDLDLRDDWPGVRENLFSAKSSQHNLQQRLKCVEWSLYRLFEMWDAAYTKDKLRPFFPPLAPLQSLNLRAALFRGLTDLKKNGVLGKEAILRKTMLDECKGDKFEEATRVFAIAVLRKEARRRYGNASGLPTGYTETLTAAENLTFKQSERLLPLILAHSHSLRRQLSQRKTTEKSFGDQQQRLDEARALLAERRRAVMARESHVPAIAGKEIAAIADHVKTVWTGNELWAEALLHGKSELMEPLPSDQHLDSGIQSVSDMTGQGSSSSSAQFLLADLNQRIGNQQLRLERWTKFRASLEKTQKSRKTDKTVQAGQPVLKFDAHQELQPLTEWCESESSTLRTEPDPENGVELIEAMRSELADLKLNHAHSKKFHDGHGGSIHDSRDTATARKRMTPSRRIRIPSELLFDSGAEDVTITCGATIVEENIDHYDLPGASRNPSHSSSDTDSDDNNPNPSLGATPKLPTKRPSDDDGPRPSNEPCPESSSYQNPKISPARPVSGYDSITEDQKRSLPRNAAEFSSTPPFHPAGPIPAEKTGLSPDFPDSTPTRSTPAIDDTPTLPPSPSPPSPPQRASTLLERTRQSMALLPTPSEPAPTNQRTPHLPTKKSSQPHPSKHCHHPSSQLSPVNHFPAPQSQQQEQKQKQKQRSITPRDQLFSDQADYASVFKSRPRIAVSPPLGTSPERGGPEAYGGDEEEDEARESVGYEGRDGGRGTLTSSPVGFRLRNGTGNGSRDRNLGRG